jgi:hypothetical protein
MDHGSGLREVFFLTLSFACRETLGLREVFACAL